MSKFLISSMLHPVPVRGPRAFSTGRCTYDTSKHPQAFSSKSNHSRHCSYNQRCGSKAFRTTVRSAMVDEALKEPPPGLSTLPWTGSQEELQALAEVKQLLQGCPYGTPDEDTMRWFLRDRKFEPMETAEKLTAMLQWRQDFKVDEITWDSVADEAATGKAYLAHYRDINDRPVIVVRGSKHFPGQRPLDDSKRLCVKLLEQGIERLPPGGETILGIFDLRGFQAKNGDWAFIRFLVDIFFTYYPKRLGQVLFVDAPWIFRPGWDIVRPWLKKYSALVRFVSTAEVREYFTPDTLPHDFK